MMKKTSTCGKF